MNGATDNSLTVVARLLAGESEHCQVHFSVIKMESMIFVHNELKLKNNKDLPSTNQILKSYFFV